MTAARKLPHHSLTFQHEALCFPLDNDLRNWCLEIKQEWHEMLFSEAGDHVLCRYFNFHLKGISALPDTLSLFAFSNIIELLSYLWEHYEKYLDPRLSCPSFFSSQYIEELSPLMLNLTQKLEQAVLPASLLKSVCTYFFSFKEKREARYTYEDLFYLKRLTSALNETIPEKFDEKQVNDVLLQYNFNQLDYLLYRQEAIRNNLPSDLLAKIKFLSQSKADLNSRPVYQGVSYHPGWPALSEMIDKWFQEELSIANQALNHTPSLPAVKSLLNLSVAHIACLLRVFRETRMLPEEGMAAVFRFVATHFKTKRQEQISDRSLSKEFYAIDQVTAAVIRGKLMEMLDWINRSYFPVLLVAGASYLLASGKRPAFPAIGN